MSLPPESDAPTSPRADALPEADTQPAEVNSTESAVHTQVRQPATHEATADGAEPAEDKQAIAHTQPESFSESAQPESPSAQAQAGQPTSPIKAEEALAQAGEAAQPQKAVELKKAQQAHLDELGEDALAPGADLPIRLPTFEGPLDLLLFLIRRNEIDIYDIPIESVTRQYMQVLHSMKELDLEVAGDFFVMAATLMYIKSRMLLPTNEQAVQPQEEEEEADPRWELVQQLLEYKKYKEAAQELQTLVERQQDFLERYYQQEQISEVERELESSDRIDLWNTFNKVLRRLSERIVKGEIQDEEISIAQSMEYILDTIKERESFRFTELLEGKRLTVAFLVSTFLAILELTRLKRLYIIQDAVFGEIECARRDNPEDEGADITEAEREEAFAARKKRRGRAASATEGAGAAALHMADEKENAIVSPTAPAADSAKDAAEGSGEEPDTDGEDSDWNEGEDLEDEDLVTRFGAKAGADRFGSTEDDGLPEGSDRDNELDDYDPESQGPENYDPEDSEGGDPDEDDPSDGDDSDGDDFDWDDNVDSDEDDSDEDDGDDWEPEEGEDKSEG